MILRERLELLRKAVDQLEQAIEAETKPASVLDGKVAIQVNNEREFKLLMEHYDSKGWKSFDNNKPNECPFANSKTVRYEDMFGTASINEYHSNRGYKIIPFADFAAEVGIKVPVKIMVSEDGVDLYHGSEAHWVSLYATKIHYMYQLTMDEGHRELDFKTTYKLFSTKEAAEKWIEEQNLVTEVETDRFGTLTVFKNGVGKEGLVYISDGQLVKIWDAFNKIKNT